jgi:hypothetical protein
VKKRGELTGKESMRAQRNTKITKGEGSFSKPSIQKNKLLNVVCHTAKENGGFVGVDN